MKPTLNKSNPEHIRMGANYEMLCQHCGEHYQPNLPIPINLIQALMKAFLKDHKRCKSIEATNKRPLQMKHVKLRAEERSDTTK